jgi:beta-lactamase class C
MAVAAAGLIGLRSLPHERVAAVFDIGAITPEDLPDQPDEWQGRIDYRALDRQLAALAARPEMAGLAVAVVEDGKLRFVGTYGLADMSSLTPVTPDTVFRWASVSKTATGALAATLSAEGALDLERPITAWRTSLRLPGDAQSRLSVEQLLSQQTGLTKNAFDEKLEEGQSPVILRSTLATAPLQCPPGTCHSYQNVAFDAASEILGEAANKPLADSVRERFFLPLGMVSARYGMEGLTGAPSWARPHRNGDVRALNDAYWRVPAAAGVESNIVDFARWMQAMMGERRDVLPGPVLQIAHRPRVATPRLYSGDLARALSDSRYGLGWRSFNYSGLSLAGHSGSVSGYRATMIFEPATRTGVVALWNSDWGIPFRVPFAVFDSYHRTAGSRWLDLSDIPLPPPQVAQEAQ